MGKCDIKCIVWLNHIFCNVICLSNLEITNQLFDFIPKTTRMLHVILCFI